MMLSIKNITSFVLLRAEMFFDVEEEEQQQQNEEKEKGIYP